VIVDAPHGVAGVDFVGIDDRVAFAEVAAHVFALGHRAIGVVAVRRGEDVEAVARPSPIAARVSIGRKPHPVRQLRLLGLLDAAEQQSVSLDGVLVTERPANARGEGTVAAASLLDDYPELTAIVCTSDILAIGVLDELAARGIEAGVALTVTGFDDVPAAAPIGLTTVRQPMDRKGRTAIQMLLDGRPRSRAKRVILPTQLVVRTSSAAPAPIRTANRPAGR
jgi:DNA-binding LacI/PurR family transcriptional regulator